jgi:hypothetical protein
MKKLYIKILGVAVFVTVLSVNVSMNRSKSSQNATVVGFSVATEANAECHDTPINTGKCSYFNNCFGDAGNPNNDCDTTKGDY